MKKPGFRKNYIVARKDACHKDWRSLFTVVSSEGNFIYCHKCSINAPTPYLYTMRKEDVEILPKCKVPNSAYVRKQLRNIKCGETQIIYLKINQSTIKLLNYKSKILALYKRSAIQGYLVDYYEIKGVCKIRLLGEKYEYKSSLCPKANVWIKVTIGAKIQRHIVKQG